VGEYRRAIEALPETGIWGIAYSSLFSILLVCVDVIFFILLHFPLILRAIPSQKLTNFNNISVQGSQSGLAPFSTNNLLERVSQSQRQMDTSTGELVKLVR
jgi:hypothetical protein